MVGFTYRTWHEQAQPLNSPQIDFQNPAATPPFLGITVQLEDKTTTEQAIALQHLRAVGFGWVRQRIDWGEVEALPAHYDWTTSDALIASISASGLTPVIVLDGSPAWARDTRDQLLEAPATAPPADPQTFARFAAEFASRYGNQVRYYQLWDEPNIAPHWGNHWIDPVGYAQLLIAASSAIRSADSDAVILTAALAPTADRGQLAIDEVYFLQRMIAAGAAPWFDALAIQPLGFGHAPSDSRQSLQRLNFQRAALIRRALIDAGMGDKPIWAVRFGWNTQPGSPWASVSKEDQRRYTLEAIQLARQNWHWLVAMGWVIDQPNAALDDPIWGFALDEGLKGEIGRGGAGEKGGKGEGERGRISLLVASFFLILWRTSAALGLLPWHDWQRRLKSPATLHTARTSLRLYSEQARYALPFDFAQGKHTLYYCASWLLLLLVYHLATWAPLIGLCWLLAAGLIALRPQVGVWLAAATLPLYFQHKELHLVDQVLFIPLALAATLCMVPAIGKSLRMLHHSQAFGSAQDKLASLWLGAGQTRNPLARLRTSSQFDLLAASWLLINLLPMLNIWQWDAYRTGLLEIGIQPLVLYGAVRLLIRSKDEQRQLVIALITGGVLVAGWGLLDWLAGGGVDADGVRRLVGPYFSPNHAALFLIRSLFLVIGISASAQRYRTGWVLIAIGIFISLLLTASRGALLFGLPAGLTVLSLYAWRNQEKRITSPSKREQQELKIWTRIFRMFADFLLFIRVHPRSSASKFQIHLENLRPLRLALPIAILLGLSARYWGWERLANSATLFSRFETWRAAFELWHHFLWFGVGANGFFWNYPAYLPANAISESGLLHPHNLWLEVATSWGIVGLAWLFAMLWLLWKTVRKTDWPGVALLAALVAALAHAQVDAFFALPDLAAWNWLVLGLLAQQRSEVIAET